jgi:HK97 gp10 family phage protein
MSAKGHSDRLARLAKARPMLRKVVFAAADELAAEAAHSITAGSVGGRSHVPSAPHEPPNADTGGLDRSIHVEKVPGDDLTARVVADAAYAAALEFGTSKIAERPFMRPAAQLVRPKLRRQIAAAIKKLGG